jgi:hypothetical protein
MLGKFKERHVFFAYFIQNADCAESCATKPDDLAPRSAKFSVKRLHSLDRRIESSLKKLFEDVNQGAKPTFGKQ